MNKTSILIDLDIFIRKTKKCNFTPKELAEYIHKYSFKHISSLKAEIYRIFIYDAPPIDKKMHNPITNKPIDFSKSEMALFRKELHSEIKKLPATALRLGKIDANSIKWNFKDYKKFKKFIRGEIKHDELNENDFILELRQKQVDMKIGIDIIWLSLKKLVDKIVLISGDSDFVPASKIARREGIMIILDPLRNNINDDLSEHIDYLRTFNIKCDNASKSI